MKLSFSTLPCGNLNAGELVQLCKKHGIFAVEIRLDTQNRVFETRDFVGLSIIKNLFDENNITITNLGTSICLLNYNKEQVLEAIFCAGMAKTVGAEGIRIFLGNFCPTKDLQKNPLDYNGIITAIKEICDASPVDIYIETHNEFATGKALGKLLAEVNRNNCKIIWDIIHPIEDGEGIYKTWENIGDKIKHIHLKDGEPWDDPSYNDWKYTKLGEGKLPIREIIKLLKKNKYNGYISLEWENLWRKELCEFPTDINWILNEYTVYMSEICKN